MRYSKILRLSSNYFGIKMMEEKILNRLIGKQYKIITKEPGDIKNHMFIGVIKEIEYDKKFIIIESSQGVGCISMESIVAIRPWQQ